MKVTPLNQFRELQILWLFPARSSDTGTAGTGIEILGSFSARPLDDVAEKKEEHGDHRSRVDWKCPALHFGNHQAFPAFLGILPTTTALGGTTWARWPSG